jgi:hypothetical protein
VYNAVSIEDLGKPTVSLANRGFVTDARSAASSKGMPMLRILGEGITCESTVMSEIDAGIEEVIDDIIGALTRPLTEEERAPRPKEVEKTSRIIFKGDLQEVNRFFYQRGWTDGMPVIPPTEEAVAEMLAGTDLAPDYLVTRLIPRMGKATIEKIAINAVMAGALPTSMPFLITGVQILMEPKARFDIFEVSTGSWSPFFIVNGPLRNDIHINCSTGAFSPGNIANSTIGRAVGLIVKNIGGARKGVEDMGVFGNPGKYSMVIGENEEASLWEPLSVERGFKKEDSTLTYFAPNCNYMTIPQTTDVPGILKMIVSPNIGAGFSCYLINPQHAGILGREGWTKQKIRAYIVEHSMAQDNRKHDPDSILIACAGGPGAFMDLITGAGGKGFNCEFVTRKVELPANWDKLVAKYKGIVPTYVRY